MDPVAEVARRGGVVRTRTLVDAGVSTYALRRAKERGVLRRVRNGWVATPDADPVVSGAIGCGVRLSCITVAERSGLWVPERGGVHVVAPAHSSRVRVPKRVVVHWGRPVMGCHPDDTSDSLVNALCLVAQCQPKEVALIIWESALNKHLVDLDKLLQCELPPAALAIAREARPFADSGLETIVIVRLRWMGLPMVPQAWIEGHRVDLLIGERLVIQLDGATHTGAQRNSDIAHDAELTLRGYHVLRFSYTQIMEQWPQVQQVIMEAVAAGLHRAR